MTPAGFPHSEIHGSKRVCRSPWLIAACRVLHRRSAPRHSPFTLSSLAIKFLRRESIHFAFLFYHPILFSKTDHFAERSAPRELVFLADPTARSRTRSGEIVSPGHHGGADRDRTDDLRLAKPPLSQLSYSPSETRPGRRAWWAWIDLNYRPHAYQACALTS